MLALVFIFSHKFGVKNLISYDIQFICPKSLLKLRIYCSKYMRIQLSLLVYRLIFNNQHTKYNQLFNTFPYVYLTQINLSVLVFPIFTHSVIVLLHFGCSLQHTHSYFVFHSSRPIHSLNVLTESL